MKPHDKDVDRHLAESIGMGSLILMLIFMVVVIIGLAVVWLFI